MVISNQLNGPFGRAHVLTLLITLIVAVNVLIGLASLGCAMAAMADPQDCLKQVRVGNGPADGCAIPSTGGSALTALAPRDPVTMELDAIRSGSDLKQDVGGFFDQAYLDPHERPPQLS